MKNTPIALLLIPMAMLSCSKGNNTKAKQFVITEEMVETEFQKEMNKHTPERCEYSPRELVESKGFFGRIKAKMAKKKIKKDFDIVYRQELTHSILKELKSYVIDQRSFKPEDFWLAISDDSRNEINTYLIEHFATLDDKDFYKLRDLVAYSFLFYFQEKDKKLGYEFQLNDPEIPIPTIRVAYSESAVFENREQLNLCGSMEPGMVIFSEPVDSEFTLPSDIKSHIVCEKEKYNQKFELRLIKGLLNIKIKMNDIEKNYSQTLGGLEVNTSNRSAKIKFSTGDENVELRVSKKRDNRAGPRQSVSERWDYKPNTISSLSLQIEKNGQKIKSKTMSCETHKEFIYEN